MFAAASSCSSDTAPTAPTYEVELIGGVAHVHNLAPLWGEGSCVALDFVHQYGDSDTSGENLQLLVRPSDVDVDVDGNVYILNSGDHEIWKFTDNERRAEVFGRRGQGPGEFIGASRLAIWPDGQLAVNDRALRAINIFDLPGTHLERLSLPTEEPTEIVALASGNLAVHSFDLGIRGNVGEPSPLLSILDRHGSTLNSFVSSAVFEDASANLFRNAIHIAADGDDNIYVSFASQNRIEKYAPDGTILFRADRPLGYEESPGIERVVTETNEGPLVAVHFNRVSTGIQVDLSGRLWVGTVERQRDRSSATSQGASGSRNEMVALEVFRNDGVLLGRIPSDFYRGQRFRIVGDRFFLVDRDEDMVVLEFRIRETC